MIPNGAGRYGPRLRVPRALRSDHDLWGARSLREL